MRCEGFCEFGNVKWGCVGNGKWVCVLEVGQSDEVEFMMSVILSFSIFFLLLKDPQSLIDHQAINYDYKTSYQIQETATVHMMWLCYLSSVVNNPTGQTSKIVEERVSIVLEHSHSVKVIQHLAKYMAPKAILMLRSAHGARKRIENGSKTGIIGFVSIKSAYYSRSRQSHENSPSMPLERARNYESSGALGSYWASL
ncbi:hypothetical protein Tco_1314036 [Tanacetum coccineum]